MTLRTFLCIDSAWRNCEEWVQLACHDSALCQNTELSPSEFVYKVAEGVVSLLLTLGLLNRELEFTLNFTHKEVVDDDVVRGGVQLVLDPHQLELVLHLWTAVEEVHGLQKTDETVFGTLKLAPQEIAHFKDNQVDVCEGIFSANSPTCFQEVVDEGVSVSKSARYEHSINFGSHFASVRVPTDV